MGAADDIKKGLTKNLANFTKQRRAEERHSYAGRWRMSRMTEVRGMYLTEAANEVMAKCYMQVSDDNKLPANARQIFYVARPLIEERTDKPLNYGYFSQTLLPNYVAKHAEECANWDVVYDDRGHFMEPHTKRVIGLGTLSVRDYLARVRPLQLEEADFAPASISTHGPSGCYGAILYIEKEGFMPLFEKVRLERRYDMGIMSAKGMSVTAARQLADGICGRMNIPLLVLHDFDRSGIIIKDTLEKSTRRFRYKHAPSVIDLGLQYEDVADLMPEPNESSISDERLAQAGLGPDAIHFLRDQRVELNAMTSRQLVDFVEVKFRQHGIAKVVPDRDTLASAYRMFARSDRLCEAFNEMKERFDTESEEQINVPENLEAKVEAKLQKDSDLTWHRAVRLTVNPHATKDENNDAEPDDDDDLEDDGP